PPLSGFWSKDAILATAWGAGQYGLFIVGSATAGLTAFYAFRMLGLVFYGIRAKPGHEEVGHEPKEASPLSWVPYSVLGVGTVLIGILGFFNLGNFLQAAAITYIYSLFSGASFSSLAPTSSFNYVSSLITIGFIIVGLFFSVQLYVRRKVSPSRIVGESGVAHTLHTFLENRWYINAVYYKVFVNAPLRASYWAFDNLEIGGLERVNDGARALALWFSAGGNWFDRNVIDMISDGAARAGKRLSRAFRRLQTGVLEQYALVLAVGLIILLLLFLLLSGVHLLI
ncbi:MAG: hypothetical protein JRN55_04385, partial [Nitrososphaerota archaeon]|nr:hypothetical protein [Nitrososphaerota archaeon]